MKVDPGLFDQFRHLVKRDVGIEVNESQAYLVEARLTTLAMQIGLGSVNDVISAVLKERGTPIYLRAVEAMTTNETLFFRDVTCFNSLKNTVFPDLIKKRAAQKRLRIWSVACSSGQEIYSILMMLKENFRELDTWNIEAFACDYSRAILERAREGKYSQIEVNRGLPAPLMIKYFKRDGMTFLINDDLRKKVNFFHQNLLGTWPPHTDFDLILCRNVLIYFDMPTKQEIVRNLSSRVRPDGYLFLGAMENMQGINDDFVILPDKAPGGYMKKPV